VSKQDEHHSDLVEIAKTNGEFRKNWGPRWGLLAYMLTAYLSAPPRSRPVLRTGWIVTLAGLATSVWKLWPW
jgi:hypothetical protein